MTASKLAACALLLVPACFHPSYDRPACGMNSECPAGLTCNAQQLCVLPGDGDAGPRADAGFDGSDQDAATDAMQSSSDARACFGTGLVQVCFAALPTAPLTLIAGPPFDTGVDANCAQRIAPGAIELCVIAGTTVTVTGAFVAIGARPLVVVGIQDVTIENAGTIDVSSRSGARRGAGANTGACATVQAAESDVGGGAGGGGGGLGSPGGRGGTGDVNMSTTADGEAIGGSGGDVQAISTLRGGCPGTKGGDSGTHAGGAGGDGGGAVYVIAGRTLTIAGNVFASGGGGGAINSNAGIEQGGGGGGAGGMIGLDGTTVSITGRVVANGGAGGGGGDLSTGGRPGDDGSTVQWNERARGGDSARDNDGSGADGTAIGHIDQLTPPAASGGGGGGAGGLGFVVVDGALTGGALVSPAPTPH